MTQIFSLRICLQQKKCGAAQLDPSRHYSGMTDAFVKIFKHEGMLGLYKGFTPGLCGVVHGAIQFMAYEELKNCYNNYYKKVIFILKVSRQKIFTMILQPIDTPISPALYLTFAAISKLFAALTTYPYQVELYCTVLYCTVLTTYPYQVVRARLQDTECKYSGTVDCVKKIIRQAAALSIYLSIYPSIKDGIVARV